VTKLLQGLRDQLVRRDYAATTIRSYVQIVDAFHQHTGARLARITPAQLHRYLDSGSSSCEHMTAENALLASAACVRGTSNSSETGSN
jgi:hypothetical protein